MALASTPKVVLGCSAFLAFWILAVFPSFPMFPVGRPAGAIAGAVLMVVFQVESPEEAYRSIDLSILGLLFGTMLVSIYLEKADMFKYLGNVLSWKSRGGKDLLCRVCVLSAFASALFTNDTICVIFTEFVLKLCRQNSLPPEPFLIALASSANIGSAATPIGNPQNLVIAVQSKISFGKFLLGIFPAMAMGVFVNTILLLTLYWKQLSRSVEVEKVCDGPFGNSKDIFCSSPSPPFDPESLSMYKKNMDETTSDVFQSCPSVALEDISQPPGLPATEHPEERNHLHSSSGFEDGKDESKLEFSTLNTINSDSLMAGRLGNKVAVHEHVGSLQITVESQSDREINSRSSAATAPTRCESPSPSGFESPPSPSMEKETALRKWKRRIWKGCVYSITVGMLVALLYGLNLSWSALTAALALMALDFKDAGPCLDKVSYSLLVFFSGMFITVDGFNRTGIPGTFWESLEPHARINNASGIAVLACVVIILSNVASNVPTVLLLGSRVAASAAALNGGAVPKSWLILAWTSTVAGNLTLVGSAANLIVSEQARKAQFLGYNLSFWKHLRFGFPATIIVVAAGLPLVRG